MILSRFNSTYWKCVISKMVLGRDHSVLVTVGRVQNSGRPSSSSCVPYFRDPVTVEHLLVCHSSQSFKSTSICARGQKSYLVILRLFVTSALSAKHAHILTCCSRPPPACRHVPVCDGTVRHEPSCRLAHTRVVQGPRDHTAPDSALRTRYAGTGRCGDE